MVWPLPLPKQPELTLPSIHLQGDVVYMRPPLISDWSQWQETRRRNQQRLQPYEPEWAPDCLTEAFFKKRLKRQIREWDIGNAQCFLIIESATHKLVGGMNINNICLGAAQYAALGYWICHESEGRGLMREALDLTIRYSFNMLKLHRLNAACLPHNQRSRKLLLAAGFEEEGFAKKYLHINSAWQDHILFGLCAENFEGNNITTIT